MRSRLRESRKLQVRQGFEYCMRQFIMSVTGLLRGHPIFFKDNKWFYTDSNTLTIDKERPCSHCGLENSKEGHDRCLGRLHEIMNACCGHGCVEGAYLQYRNGKIITGVQAVKEIKKIKLQASEVLNENHTGLMRRNWKQRRLETDN